MKEVLLMTLQEKTSEIVLGISMKPDELYQFLLNAIATSSRLRIVSSDKATLKARFAWIWNDWSKEEYNFDLAMSVERDVCDVHCSPKSPSYSRHLSHAVALLIYVI